MRRNQQFVAFALMLAAIAIGIWIASGIWTVVGGPGDGRDGTAPAAAAAEPERAVVAADATSERRAPGATLRLLTAPDRPLPDGAVTVIELAGERRHEIRIAAGVGEREFVPGRLRLASLSDPPTFAACEVEVVAGRNDIAVQPLARLRLRFVDLEDRPVAAALFDHGVVKMLTADVEGAVRGGRRDGPAVLARLAQAPSDAVADGALVPADGTICIVGLGADVLRVMPAHAAWFGTMAERGDDRVGGESASIGGIRAPVSAPVDAEPGTDFEVGIALARPGAIELRLAGWPLGGTTTIVARRHGMPGIDAATHAWKIAADRVLDRAGADAEREVVTLDALPPGSYRLDAQDLRTGALTCGLLFAEVAAGQTTVRMLAEGIGRHQLVIEVAEPRGEGHLIVNARPPVSTPPEAVMRSSNVLTVALESLPAGEFRVDGLVGTRGTVLFTAGGSAEFDLLRSERCILE